MGLHIVTDEVLSYGFPKPRTVWLWFAVPFAVAWLLSFGWAWLVVFILEANFDVPENRNAYSWGDGLMLLGGIFIGLWCFRNIAHQLGRVINFSRVVNALGELVDIVFQNANPNEGLVVGVTLSDGVGGSVDLSTPQAIHELVAMILVSGVLLLWQFSSTTRHLQEVFGIVDTLTTTRDRFSGKVPVLFKTILGATREEYVSLTMLGLVRSRVEAWTARDDHTATFYLSLNPDKDKARELPPEYMLHNRTRIIDAISKVTNEINNAVIMEDLQVWSGIHIANKILGVIYLILLPGIIWPSQGRWIVVTYPVVFLFVGGLVAYNIFLSDVFQSPSTTHTAIIYDRMLRIESYSDTALYNMYPDFCARLGGTSYFNIIHKFFRWNPSSKTC